MGMMCLCTWGIPCVAQAWNKHDLGGGCRDINVQQASVLHWSGQGKAWRRLDDNGGKFACAVDYVWQKYDLKPKAVSMGIKAIM
eukprot:7213629-Pyramimonas_sp.AAC.1